MTVAAAVLASATFQSRWLGGAAGVIDSPRVECALLRSTIRPEQGLKTGLRLPSARYASPRSIRGQNPMLDTPQIAQITTTLTAVIRLTIPRERSGMSWARASPS